MININLIAERRARKMREITILRMSVLCVLCVLIFMVSLNLYAWLMHQVAQHNLRSIQEQLVAIQPKYAQLLKIQARIDERQPVVTLLNQVQISEGAWMTMLADISRITAPNVMISGLGSTADEKGVSLRISGHAHDQKTVAAFMLALRQQTRWAGMPVLQSVSTSTQETQGTAIVQFDLTVPVRGLVGGEL